MNNKYLHIIRLFRPAQWLKNGFVLLPLFFGGKVLDWECWRSAIPAFFAFCLMASAVYCLNDVRDVEADRIHPQKCRRPVASGAVSVATATGVMILLIAASLAIALLLCGDAGIKVALVIAGYFVLNVAYCLKLKYYAIVDVFVVAFGFVLRLLCGGVAADIPLSPWIVLMTFLLALFLAFAKRRDDLVIYENDGVVSRGNILNYNMPFMNQTLGIIGAITIMCYILYTLSPEVMERLHTQYLYLTCVFVIAAILRYLQVTIVRANSGSPTQILIQDRFIQACVAGWIITFAIILYF